MLDLKAAVLGNSPDRVPVDLRDDCPAALLGAGFRPERPTLWLVEA